jgi:drug/metabolite transporter (DMT)-like permease
MTTQPTISNWLSVLALGVIWGGTFMVVTIALRGYGPFTVACARTTLGAIALLGMLRVFGKPLPMLHGRALGLMITIGILNTALPFSLLSWGQQYVPSAFAGISMAALPLFVLPLAHVFSDEPLSARKSVGVVLGFVGAIVLIGPGVLRIGSGLEPLGQIACLAASLSYAISSLLTRNFPPMEPMALATWTLIVGSVCLIPIMLMIEGVPVWADTQSGLAIVF